MNPQKIVAGAFITFALSAGAVLLALRPEVPRTWDERALETGVLQPPVLRAKVKPISAQYYYGMRERVMYNRYPVYATKSEPAGYQQKLASVEPEVTFDPAKFKSEDDWIAAGKEVFRYPIGLFPMDMVPVWRTILERTGVPPARDGTYPQISIIVPKQGMLMAGFLSCATCHTRVLADGTTIEGGQGTVPDLLLGFPPDVKIARAFQRSLFHVPWIENDSIDRVQNMSMDEINAIKAAIPLGVVARHGTSLFTPVQIPDLIGVRDRKYLDHTGLIRHRGIGDLMRYAALNQGADLLSDYGGGFRPTGAAVGGRDGAIDGQLPAPELLERYSDAQLFALAKYVYSLTPPPNPNRPTELSRRGEGVFAREGCGRCHTPPLYTANKLTPALGFVVPAKHRHLYDIEPTVIGTDPALTLRTRRGTGYYKIPSLRGVWYRGPFEHSGSVATLEDWFDPNRLRSDYVPTGFKGYGIEHRAVPGHPFGLGLSAEDKSALIAFLKTL